MRLLCSTVVYFYCILVLVGTCWAENVDIDMIDQKGKDMMVYVPKANKQMWQSQLSKNFTVNMFPSFSDGHGGDSSGGV